MTDIIGRLRKRTMFQNDADAKEAADEIERLRAALQAIVDVDGEASEKPTLAEHQMVDIATSALNANQQSQDKL